MNGNMDAPSLGGPDPVCSFCGKPAAHTFGEAFEVPTGDGVWVREYVFCMPLSFAGVPVEGFVGVAEPMVYAECDAHFLTGECV